MCQKVWFTGIHITGERWGGYGREQGEGQNCLSHCRRWRDSAGVSTVGHSRWATRVKWGLERTLGRTRGSLPWCGSGISWYVFSTYLHDCAPIVQTPDTIHFTASFSHRDPADKCSMHSLVTWKYPIMPTSALSTGPMSKTIQQTIGFFRKVGSVFAMRMWSGV